MAKSKGTQIIPVRIDAFFGKDTTIETYPAGSIWIAVHVVGGKVIQDITDYGYRSLEELKEAYKDEDVMEVA